MFQRVLVYSNIWHTYDTTAVSYHTEGNIYHLRVEQEECDVMNCCTHYPFIMPVSYLFVSAASSHLGVIVTGAWLYDNDGRCRVCYSSKVLVFQRVAVCRRVLRYYCCTAVTWYTTIMHTHTYAVHLHRYTCTYIS